jgi:ketosteroid isomerase-like protein
MDTDQHTELDDFLASTMPHLVEAERAIHNGDAQPRHAMWSRNEPVTVFGAWLSRSGQEDVRGLFDDLAETFSDCTSYGEELVAAGTSGDLAYTVTYENSSVSVNGKPRTYTLRVTHVYRREDGEWKIVHRHGDEMAEGQEHLPGTSYS